MNRLIRTPRRRHIIIIPQIDKKLLIRTNQPSTQIRPLNIRRAPLHSITTKHKRPIRILRRIKRHRQLHCRRGILFHIRIQETPASNQLDKLSGNDLELAGCGVGIEDGGSWGILGFCLEVFVEVRGFDGADPVVA